VKFQSRLDDHGGNFLNLRLEVFQVSSKEGVEDFLKRLVIGERNGNLPEMSLISGVNKERSSRWVHGSHMLTFYDFFNGKFADIIPMFIISMLSQ